MIFLLAHNLSTLSLCYSCLKLILLRCPHRYSCLILNSYNMQKAIDIHQTKWVCHIMYVVLNSAFFKLSAWTEVMSLLKVWLQWEFISSKKYQKYSLWRAKANKKYNVNTEIACCLNWTNLIYFHYKISF